MNGETSLCNFPEALLLPSDAGCAKYCSETLVNELVNGHATDFVYSVLSVPERREHGVFFSGPEWAEKILSKVNFLNWKRFVDPSVGVGDLLLAVCKRLPLEETLKKTLDNWSERLVAVDLRKSFLEIAWMRIQAMAMHRHKTEKSEPHELKFRPLPKSFIVGDALLVELNLRSDDCVIMNPPYQRILAAPKSFVGSGMRSAAALHLERILLQASKGTGIFALIPDVLRSGSSYERFRKELKMRGQVLSFEAFGAFGPAADIDVAILAAIIGTSEDKVSDAEMHDDYEVVGDRFLISVGPVVPHRTPTTGEPYGYLTAKNATVGSEISAPVEVAAYTSRLEKGPFVVVRRTSSPTDNMRARATVITSKENFLVENHLIILKPKDNKVKTCRDLVKVLSNQRTNDWLNNFIRCRHLTVGALKQLPWISS